VVENIPLPYVKKNGQNLSECSVPERILLVLSRGARILLLVAAGRHDKNIQEILGISTPTIWSTTKRFY
jgi:hypothetical protein